MQTGCPGLLLAAAHDLPAGRPRGACTACAGTCREGPAWHATAMTTGPPQQPRLAPGVRVHTAEGGRGAAGPPCAASRGPRGDAPPAHPWFCPPPRHGLGGGAGSSRPCALGRHKPARLRRVWRASLDSSEEHSLTPRREPGLCRPRSAHVVPGCSPPPPSRHRHAHRLRGPRGPHRMGVAGEAPVAWAVTDLSEAGTAAGPGA